MRTIEKKIHKKFPTIRNGFVRGVTFFENFTPIGSNDNEKKIL